MTAVRFVSLFAGVFALAVVPAFARDDPAAARTDAAARFERRVGSIAARQTPEGRLEAVVKELEALGLEPRRRPFEGPRRAGLNVLAEVPAAADDAGDDGAAAKPVLMLGAHADRVVAGAGAVDNAGGCAAVLELVGRFQARPLANHRVVGLWFDQEEQGLLGSRAFVEAAGDPAAPGASASLPAAFVNVDVFAYGDTLWVCKPGERDAPLAAPFEGALKPDGTVFPAVVGATYPPSDHLSFAAVRKDADPGTPAADLRVISLSLLPREQIEETVTFLEAMENGGRPGLAGLPAILRLIHTANDVPAAVRPAEAAAALDAVEAALRTWDAAAE